MTFSSRKTSLVILLLPFLLSFLAPVVSSTYTVEAMEDESEDKKSPSETWDLNNDGKYVDCVDEVDLSLIHI